jgi:hypothetical protein
MTVDNDDGYRILTLRLLASRYGAPRAEGVDQLELLPGRLPDGLPVEIPVPDGGTVVASFAWPFHAAIVLESSLPPPECFDAYIARLEASGWEVRPFGGEHGSFPSVDAPPGNRTFLCHPSTGSFLSIDVLQLQNGNTEIELDLSTDPHDPRCFQHEESRRRLAAAIPAIYDRLPTLLPPRGATQGGETGERDEESATAIGFLYTDLDLSVIANHYRRQMEEQGWTLRESGHGEKAAWSTWTSHDGAEERHGALWCAARIQDDPAVYLLHVQAGRSARRANPYDRRSTARFRK